MPSWDDLLWGWDIDKKSRPATVPTSKGRVRCEVKFARATDEALSVDVLLGRGSLKSVIWREGMGRLSTKSVGLDTWQRPWEKYPGYGVPGDSCSSTRY